ncbi:MAG: ABC transporter permease [Desulfobacteraceae bacterium]|nr:MAG: ABC transporter permease [Desulfobacteraceae bacterium]
MRLLRKYWMLLKVNWRVLIEYRVGMLIWMLANTLPLVMLAVWLSIAEAGPVGGYGPLEFTAYYLALLAVRQFTAVWVAWELDYDIRLGELSSKLLKPINPIHNHIAMHLGDKLFRMLTIVPIILMVMLWLPGLPLRHDWITVGLFCFSTLAALAMRFLTQYAIGLLGFWTTQSLAINEMVYAGMLMFGGIIAPLEIFPPALFAWTQYLPFRYMLSLPVEILMGRIGGAALAAALGQQIVWLLLCLAFYRTVWRKGLKHYSAVGA